jgi:hypothetical protein
VETKAVNIAPMPATSQGDLGVMAVTKEQFEREASYGAAMAVARSMLTRGLISEKDYRKVDTMFKKKYRPLIGGMETKIT